MYLLFQGVFCVGVSEGQDLVKKDKHLIGGKSDPYVVLRYIVLYVVSSVVYSI